MKKILLAIGLALLPTLASAQCNGIFANNTICGNLTGSPNVARPVAVGSLPFGLVIGTSTITGGTTGRILYDNGGVLGEYAIPLAVTLGGSGTATQFTQGSIIFAGASGVYSQNNSKLFWDNTNFRLGVGAGTGVTTPDALLLVSQGFSNGTIGIPVHLHDDTASASVAGTGYGIWLTYSAFATPLDFGMIGGYGDGTNLGIGIWSQVHSGAPQFQVAGTSGFLLRGTSSGIVTVQPQAAAGTPTVTWGTSTGTPAVTATSPLVIAAATGNITCTTCATTTNGGALTATAPITLSAAGLIAINAPYGSLTANNGGIVYSGATNLAILNGTATANLPLLSGSSTTPAWGGVTYFGGSTVTSGGVPYFSSTTAMVSSGLLGANQIMVGGGAGAAPTTFACATTTTVVHGGTPPTCATVAFGDIASAAIATTSQWEANTTSLIMTTDQLWASGAFTTITFGSTTTVDLSTLVNGAVTLTGNITTLTWSNCKNGQTGAIKFIQDGTGSRTVPAAWNSSFRWTGGTRPALSTAASAIDWLFYQCVSSTEVFTSLQKAVAN